MFKNMSTDKFISRFFRPVDNMVWDLMSGKVGFRSNNGIITIDIEKDPDTPNKVLNAQIVVNMFDEFGIGVPAFAQSVSADQITIGDMIYSSSKDDLLGWVISANNGKQFKLMKSDGTTVNWSPVKTQMLGLDSGTMVIRSLMNMMPGSNLSNMQSMLMPMMMSGMFEDGNGSDMLSKMMPMMLMSNTGMMGNIDNNAMSQMMPMMMMMKMMKD